MSLNRPEGLFDREREWRDLAAFVADPGDENRLAIVLGRRRQGKSMLVRHVVEATGGFLFEAAQQSSNQNLTEFSRAWAAYSGAPGLAFESWGSVVDHLESRSATTEPFVVAIDEVGYLIDAAPELPSLLQRLFTERPGGRLRVILCGSAFAQMRRLLAPEAPLRGRQHRTVQINPFGYRVAADYWGLLGNPESAFRLHALIGGTPAYRRFSTNAPLVDGDVDQFAVAHLLQPTSVLFSEGRAIVTDDDSLADKALYWAVLNAIADGATRRGDVAAALGRSDAALHVPIETLVAAALVERRPDPFNRRATTLIATEPMLRTERILLSPERARLDRGRAADVWSDAQPRLARRVYGPHLEWMASEWMLSHATAETVGGHIRSATSATVRRFGQRSQLDIVATAPDRNDADRICAVGECKAGKEPVGAEVLNRLDQVVEQNHQQIPATAKRLVFARAGFTADLNRAARGRSDVELVDLTRLYHGE